MPDIVNVPNVAGVPALLFSAGSQTVASLLTGDTYDYFAGAFGPQWGIFAGGAPVVTADTVTAFDYRQEWTISDYPLEQGSFESYDKVATPFQGRFQFAAGGSAAAREALLSSIAAIAGDLNLYDISTPEAVYENVNILHYDYHRTAVNGVGMILVDVWVTEIRISAAGGQGASQAPSGANQVNGGTVQPQAASLAQQQDAGEVT